MKILVACEESQAVTIELRKLGHEAFSCDIEPCSGGHPEWHIKRNVLEVLKPSYDGMFSENSINFWTEAGEFVEMKGGWDMMIAHPPCTRLTNAGVRWLKDPPKSKTLVEIWREFFDGVEFYKAIRSAPIKLKAIENPIMHKYAKEAIGNIKRNIVQPWWFGDKAFKATGWELYGLEPLVPTNKLVPPKSGTEEYKEWSFIHRMPPGQERSKLRSKTFPGMAKAMAEQWTK